MKNLPAHSLLAVLALSLGMSSCVITIDDAGASWHGFGSSHYNDTSGPRHRGSGTLGEDPRALPAFEAVELQGVLDLEVTVEPGAEQSVVVTGDDNLLEFVRTEVRDGVLHVDLDSGSYNLKQSLSVVATVPHLVAVSLEGSGDILVSGVDAERFEVGLTGSGDVSIDGRAGNLRVALLGSGDVDLAGLEASAASVRLDGSGDIRVSASESLTIELNGSGDIGYRGNPRVGMTIHGSGDVYSFN